ncbi:MAG: protein TolQ [Myxococcota bacterium]
MDNTIFVNFVTLQAPEGEGLNPWELILDASFVVQLVMLALVLMSVLCWFIIGAKLVRLAQAASQSNRFLDMFWGKEANEPWSAERLEAVYAQIGSYKGSPVAAVFRAGYVELARIASGDAPAGGNTDNVDRALRRSKNNEMLALETFIPFLATTGSTAPFIGLFGTVWGIMNSFIAIGNQSNASLDVVAPGIAEALIATAIGLAAAIPAVWAYNYLIRKIRVLEGEVDAFSSDYLNIVRRHFLTS